MGIIQSTSVARSQESSILYSEIHTFNPPGNLLIVDALSFQESWYYSLSFEVVSPHYCQTNISITDPDGYNYLLYSGLITNDPKNVLYGSSFTGEHSLIIEFSTTETLNFHMQVQAIGEISEGIEISGRIIQSQSFRFLPNESREESSFMLEKSDECSVDLFPITPLQVNSSCSLNITLEDPKGKLFSFYQGALEDTFSFKFQTNDMGVHVLIMDIQSLKFPLNMIVIVSLHKKNSNLTYSIPLEAQLYSGIILLTLLLLPYLIIRKLK